MTLLLTSVDLWVQSLSTCLCKLLSQKRRDFTHLVSKPCECVAIHYKLSRQMPWKLKINLTCLVMLYCFSSYFVIFIYTLLFLVILSVSEVSTKSKYGFFAFLQRLKNDKSEFLRDFIVGKFCENLRGVLSLQAPNTQKFTRSLKI